MMFDCGFTEPDGEDDRRVPDSTVAPGVPDGGRGPTARGRRALLPHAARDRTAARHTVAQAGGEVSIYTRRRRTVPSSS